MTDLVALSTRILDTGEATGPINRINFELSELDDSLAIVEAFSHSVLFDTDDGLLVFDTSGHRGGDRVVEAIRSWSNSKFNTLVYTHGHLDHVGGSGFFAADCRDRGGPLPQVVGHANVPRRFDRYQMTNGYNLAINARQFRGFGGRGYGIGGNQDSFLPEQTLRPQLTYESRMDLSVGGLEFELHHARGETDDHSWAWFPSRKIICAGDFFIWNFPNAGNPQKVQRYPLEWAIALRTMAGMGAELFIPAHGLPIAGHDRIAKVLGEVADTLERLVREVVEMMNAGAPLNDIIHSVSVPAKTLAKPYLAPLYDEPEFVVNNIWRLYGGWYDGNPAHLKPAPSAALAQELAALAGGAGNLAKRALELSAAGDHRLACHLVEMALAAEPEAASIHPLRAEIYQRRRDSETSMMAKGIFGHVAGESRRKAGIDDR